MLLNTSKIILSIFINHPEHIYKSWQSPNHHCLQYEHGCLFQFSNNNGNPLGNFKTNGDLVNIRNGNSSCPDSELTEKIRNDERIPKDGKNITIDNLDVFAEY